MWRLRKEGYRSYPGRSVRYAPDKRDKEKKVSHRSNPCRKAAVELTEVSFTHSTDEVANHHRGKGWTVRDCVKSKLIDCVWKQLLYGDWMTDGRLEVESKSQECWVIIKREVTSNNLPKRRVLSSTHGVVGGRRLATASYPILLLNFSLFTKLAFGALEVIGNSE